MCFLLLGTSFATVEDAAYRTMPATALRGTGLLRSLRKVCALSCASPSTGNPNITEKTSRRAFLEKEKVMAGDGSEGGKPNLETAGLYEGAPNPSKTPRSLFGKAD